jgi:hypothetical protein
MIIYFFIYGRFLVLVVLLPGAGGASLVLVVVLPGGADRIFPADHPGGHAQSSSVRRAVLLLNQGFGVKFKDAIALIINYLGAPFGWTFTEQYVG